MAKVPRACDARADADTVIIARTDALGPHGVGRDPEWRARAYREPSGAYWVFVDGIRTVIFDTYIDRLGDLPLV